MTFSEKDICILCNKSALISCDNCGAKFCGRNHEILHRHDQSEEGSTKKTCYPIKIQEADGVGRYMVASRDIKAGEVIFKDIPIGVGPNHESSPICLTCNGKVDCSFTCSNCLYPLCDQSCAESEHHLGLCKILSAEKDRENVLQFGSKSKSTPQPYAYHVILPLKLILLKQQNPDRFALMDRLMDHNENRIKDPYWNECQDKIVDRIIDRCGRSDLDGSEIHRIIGILETNAYEIYSNVYYGFRGLFPLSSLLSHGCRSNTFHQFSTEAPFTNTCLAAIDLKEGDEIFSTYVTLTQCTLTRRKKLSECWYFDCACQRCSDPTELGSFAGAIICKACSGSSKEKNFMIQIDPLNSNSNFECLSCKAKDSSQRIETLIQDYCEKIRELSLNYFEEKEQLISLHKRASQIFHPCHEVMTDLATWLVPILCRARGKTPTDFPEGELALKQDLCKNVLAVLDKVNPGINRKRGKILYELAEMEVAYLSIGQEDEDNIPSFTEIRDQLTSIISHCKESIRCLSNIGKLTFFEETMIRSAHKLQLNAETLFRTFR